MISLQQSCSSLREQIEDEEDKLKEVRKKKLHMLSIYLKKTTDQMFLTVRCCGDFSYEEYYGQYFGINVAAGTLLPLFIFKQCLLFLSIIAEPTDK